MHLQRAIEVLRSCQPLEHGLAQKERLRREMHDQLDWLQSYKSHRERPAQCSPPRRGSLLPRVVDDEPALIAFAEEVAAGAYVLAQILGVPSPARWTMVQNTKQRVQQDDGPVGDEEDDPGDDIIHSLPKDHVDGKHAGVQHSPGAFF